MIADADVRLIVNINDLRKKNPKRATEYNACAVICRVVCLLQLNTAIYVEYSITVNFYNSNYKLTAVKSVKQFYFSLECNMQQAVTGRETNKTHDCILLKLLTDSCPIFILCNTLILYILYHNMLVSVALM